MNLDHDIAQRNLSQALDVVYKQLKAAQLEFWPDSRIMTFDEVRKEWLNFGGLPKYVKIYADWKEDPENLLFCLGADGKPDDVQARRSYHAHVSDVWARNKNQMYQGIINALQYQCVVFYECHKLDNGKYEYRGARYGILGPEYFSGFPSP